jgi:hypothetical protein
MAQRAGHPRPVLRSALLQSRGGLSVRFCGQRLAKLLKMESYRLLNEKSDITTPNTSLMPCLPALPVCAKITIFAQKASLSFSAVAFLDLIVFPPS